MPPKLRGKWAQGIQPRSFTWILKDKLAIKVIWMQLSVRHDAAAAEAEAAGIKVVMNRCPKIEFGRLSGELSWGGINSGVITSKRRATVK